MRFGKTISRYLIGAVLPYFLFAWILLSVILFVQQASRFSDIFFSVNVPGSLVWQLTLALVPSVLSFTCPMAALVGVIIGLSKMQGDSELVAIRAAGVGNAQITLPILVLGVVLSALAFVINIVGVPLAASIVRNVAIQAAIYKLESPIEPGVFNTELAGYTVYVKDGDIEAGTWKNIFIHTEDEKTGTVRLITSRRGRIDSSGQASELVLENAVVSTFTREKAGEKFASENIGEFRFAIKTKRGELIEKLGSAEVTPDELGLNELAAYAGTREGSERTEAQILWQRRVVLSITPIIFCLLGTSMVLRFSGKGRGFGVFVALIALIGYYLIAFLGEQLIRTGRLSIFAGSILPVSVALAFVAWFNYGKRFAIFEGSWRSTASAITARLPRFRRSARKRNLFVDLTTGLRDFDIGFDLVRYYVLTLAFLGAVFVIFTAFELWKFAGTMDGGVAALGKYLLYLLPFVYLQLAPSAAMVATLATYVIKSRQNEIVTWISAGQSTYRLLLPCFTLMLLLGAANWIIQERIATVTNQQQDTLRAAIRSRGAKPKTTGRHWIATDKRIYSFKLDRSTDLPIISASDNDKRALPMRCSGNCSVTDLTVYEFADNGKLQHLYHSSEADWTRGRIILGPGASRKVLGEGRIATTPVVGTELSESVDPFVTLRKKPSHLSSAQTAEQIEQSESDLERRNFTVALHKKYSTAVLPFIIALFTAPFALSLSRKGKVVTIAYAVGLWLLFTAATSVLEQFGGSGMLSPAIAIWAPLLLFSLLGLILLSRVKT